MYILRTTHAVYKHVLYLTALASRMRETLKVRISQVEKRACGVYVLLMKAMTTF
jgi:hypothetical protein